MPFRKSKFTSVSAKQMQQSYLISVFIGMQILIVQKAWITISLFNKGHIRNGRDPSNTCSCDVLYQPQVLPFSHLMKEGVLLSTMTKRNTPQNKQHTNLLQTKS